MFKRTARLFLIGFCTVESASSIEIELRYDYDSSGFFNQAGAKQAMRGCADFFEEILTDSLTEINAATSGNSQNTWTAQPQNPATGATLNLVNLVVPADTIIIYLGARNLGGGTTGVASTGLGVSGFEPFFSRVQDRGQIGALSNPATDYGPWGGSISFDTTLSSGAPRQWNFSTTGKVAGKTDFVGVALHELCHILGIGQAKSWRDLAPSNATFLGEASIIANGGLAPVLQDDKGHWRGTSPGPYISTAYGMFGTPHGLPQQVLMNPATSGGIQDIEVVTDLEIAALIDLGWEVSPPARGELVREFINGELTMSIPTSSNFTYQVQRGNLTTPFANLSPVIVGDGSVKTYIDANPPALRGFYRFSVSRPAPAARARMVAPLVSKSKLKTFSDSWQSVGCCVGH